MADKANKLADALMGLIPANARLLAKSVFLPGNVNESNFTAKELEAQRQAILNSQKRVNEAKKTDMSDYLNTLRSMEDTDQIQSKFSDNLNKFIPVSQEYEQVVRHISPTIQYPDYPISHEYDAYGVGDMPLSASFKDPAYAMSTTIGRAEYKTDPQGNIHVIDKYNFPRGHDMQDYGKWSPAFKLGHFLGEKYSKEMPVDINLGNPNTWKNK